jgi:S1-C subfamily serine protease
MKPFLRTWVVLLLGAIVFVAGLFWVRANFAELQKKDPLTESQERIEDAFGMTLAKESGPAGDGLLVEAVDPEGVAARAGLDVGDRVMAVGDRSVWHIYQFADLVNASISVAPFLPLLVERDGDYRAVVIGHRAGPLVMPDVDHSGHAHH